jgi:hypothetical protein
MYRFLKSSKTDLSIYLHRLLGRLITKSLFGLTLTGMILMKVADSNAQTCSTKPLSFGYVWEGQTKHIDKYDLSKSMCVHLTQSRSPRIYQLYLPTHLSNGTHHLPISFSSTDAAYTYITTFTVGPITFDPRTSFISPHGTAHVFFFIGGTLQVPMGVSTGNYSAWVTITVEYY